MIEIAVIIAVIVFSVTCFFVVRTLIALQLSVLSLQVKLENLSDESVLSLRKLDARLALFDSTFRSISNIGDICEGKTLSLKNHSFEKKAFVNEEKINLSEEIVQWAVISAHLYQQIFKRRT